MGACVCGGLWGGGYQCNFLFCFCSCFSLHYTTLHYTTLHYTTYLLVEFDAQYKLVLIKQKNCKNSIFL